VNPIRALADGYYGYASRKLSHRLAKAIDHRCALKVICWECCNDIRDV
jgi:hypothetical protein